MTQSAPLFFFSLLIYSNHTVNRNISLGLSIKILVIWTLFAKKVLQNVLGKVEILAFFVSLSELFVDKPQISYGNCSIFVVIVIVSPPENFNSLIIVLYRFLIFLQALFRVSQVSQTLSNFNCFSFALSVLLDDQGSNLKNNYFSYFLCFL